MLVLLRKGTAEAAAGEVASRLRLFGLSVHRTDHEGRVRLAAVGEVNGVAWNAGRAWAEVESAHAIGVPFKLVSRTFHPQNTVISVGRCAIGSDQLVLMAGGRAVRGGGGGAHAC